MSLPTTMRAIVLMGKDQLEMQTVAVPQPGPLDVLIRVESCAICRSDLSMMEEPFPGQGPYGKMILGHEYAGTVVALGETVDEFKVGDRVAVEAHLGCGRCRNCRLGDYTSCLNTGNLKKGHRCNGHTTPGAYTQYVVNHLNTVYKIPDSVSFDEASLVTNLGCVLYGYENLGGYIAGQSVLVIGAGPLGLVSAAAAHALAADRVFLSDVLADRLSFGKKIGADRMIDASQEDPLKVILDETDGRGVDYVVESSGTQAGLNLAVKALRRNGKVLMLAIAHHPLTVDFKDLSLNDKDIITNRGEGRANVGRAVSLLATGLVDLTPLVTHVFPLADYQEAIATFRERRDGAVKVVLHPQE
jgi:2-desacetyl-2-hydroxyethyl bacteriochlorophyllide A dehydrogenase